MKISRSDRYGRRKSRKQLIMNENICLLFTIVAFLLLMNLSIGSEDLTANMNQSNASVNMPIWVGIPRVISEGSNQYWWLNYNFSVVMRSQDQGGNLIGVTLYTDTDRHPWRAVANKEVLLTQNPTLIYFRVKPFDIFDANGTYRYKFVYTEKDQKGKNFTEMQGSGPINPRLMTYNWISIIGIFTYIMMISTSLLLSILIERRFFR
jgi:hypothetical protein